MADFAPFQLSRCALKRLCALLLCAACFNGWSVTSWAQPVEKAPPQPETAQPAPTPPAQNVAEPPAQQTPPPTLPPPPAPEPRQPTPSRQEPGLPPEVTIVAPSNLQVRYALESIQVTGNVRTRSRVVLRYVPFKPGDIIDVDDPQVQLTRYRLLGTGFFRDVQFSLRKGSRRGYVVLVIEVVERNTIVVNDLWMGLSADADTQGNARPLTAYAGIDVSETNLAGTGITLGSAIGIAQDQLALRVRFVDPAFLGGPWMTSGTLLFNDARDFFGNAGVYYYDPSLTRRADHAVVRYQRFGGMLGVGRDLSIATQLWLAYRLETIDAAYPLQASHLRGLQREPIDFNIIRGRSILSTLRATAQYDTRDQPFLPTRGWFTTVVGELGLLPTGSDYGYQRLELHATHWWTLPWKNHVVSLDLFGGAIAGDAPFFEQFYVGDLSDFLPARELGVNFDRRPPPNFLGTDIVEVRYGEYAAKIDGEYRIPFYRGSRSIYGIDGFLSTGIYAVASRRDLTNPPVGYKGAALIPVDLTFNLGFRMDTSVGGFVFAFSNVLGFVPLHGQGPAGE